MKNIDFLFIYESKIREFQSLCLLKYELEKRGYSVLIKYINSKEAEMCRHIKYHAKVLATYGCYTNATIEWCIGKYILFDKLINLQWEQVLNKAMEDDPKGFKNFSGLAKEVVHIAWGEATKKRLVRTAGILPERVKVTGHIGMDFLRPEFASYYFSRAEICKEFSINPKSVLCLFSSDYGTASASDEVIEQKVKLYGEWRREVLLCARKNKAEIIKWISTITCQNKNIVFIYRPHPGEQIDDVRKAVAAIANFRIIDKYSVQQWITICDMFYSSFSTTAVEAYFAGKNVQILCPYNYSDEGKTRVFTNADIIATYSDFADSIQTPKMNVLDSKYLKQYFDNDKHYSFIKYADVFEKVYKDDFYDFDWKKYNSSITTQEQSNLLKKSMNRYAFFTFLFIFFVKIHLLHGEKYDVIRQRQKELQEERKKNTTCTTEIAELIKKISKIVEKRN